MEKYVVKKRNRNKKIVKLNFKDEGFLCTPNIKNKNFIKISSLSLMNEGDITHFLTKKIERSFRKLAGVILSILKSDNDTTSGEAALALNELAKEKSLIQREYKEYLKKEEKELYLKRLKALEVELKEKIVYLKLKEEEQKEELEKDRSR